MAMDQPTSKALEETKQKIEEIQQMIQLPGWKHFMEFCRRSTISSMEVLTGIQTTESQRTYIAGAVRAWRDMGEWAQKEIRNSEAVVSNLTQQHQRKQERER